MNLDEGLRHRLRAAAEAVPDDERAADWDRLAKLVADVGPRRVRAARRRRAALLAGAVLFAAVAPIAAWYLVRALSTPPAAPPPLAALPPCATRPAPGAATPAPQADGSEHFDLGPAGRIVLDAGAAATLAQRSPCRTVLDLREGRVTVLARDLAGGQLRVHTPACDVVVRGTLFAVAAAPAAVEIEVVEGQVTVERSGEEIARVGGGESLLVRGTRRELAPLSAAAVERIRSRAGLAAAPPAPEAPRLRPPAPPVAPLEPSPGSGAPPVATSPNAPANGAAPGTPPSPVSRPPATSARRTPTGTAEVPQDALYRARELRARGDLAGARRAFARAGDGTGPTAEGAWLELARMELGCGDPRAAREALAEHDRRFGTASPLALEAAGLSLRAAREAGDRDAADRIAREIVRRWPDAAQATVARQWLAERGLGND